jgi:hypothetical protein
LEGEKGQRQNAHQGKHGIARMTQAQGSLREVIDDRKNHWVSADRNEEGTAENPQASKRSDDSYKHEDIPGKNECHERGAWKEKITLRRFGAKPCGDNSPTEELHRQAGMRADELPGVLPFVVEECGLAKLGVAADLFESGDAIHRAGRLVVDLVVAHPEFEWKIGTQRNQPMELNGVAHSPGKAHGREDADGKRKACRAQGTLAIVAVRDPAKVEWKEHAEGRIRMQG